MTQRKEHSWNEWDYENRHTPVWVMTSASAPITRTNLSWKCCLLRKQSSGMWCRVEIVLTDVSEERIASIFRVEDKKNSASEPAWAGATDCLLFMYYQVIVVHTAPVHQEMFLLLLVLSSGQLSGSNDASAKHSGSVRFESLPGYWLSRLRFSWLSSVPKRISLLAACLLLEWLTLRPWWRNQYFCSQDS
jgi:hypothetical protein